MFSFSGAPRRSNRLLNEYPDINDGKKEILA
jgi:hypothetical protein